MAENNFRADRLQEAINTYGVDLPEGVIWDNEKMIKVLGDYFINLSPDKYSWGARYVQSLNTVMLCDHLHKFIKNFDVSPLESEDYVAETKENGMRCLAVYSPESGFEFFTRRESVTNYLNGNIADKFLFINKGLITEPKDYINKFNYRFVLDGELLVEGIENELVSSQITVEDYVQSIFSSSVERAKNFQKDGHRLKMVVFDVLYFEKNPVIPAAWTPKYNYHDVELTQEVIDWVNNTFGKYLKSACFKSVGRAKKLYQYLYTLKDVGEFDVRKYPFKLRRNLRKLLVNFLSQNNLPFIEVQGEDVYKVAFTDQVLREGGEGSIIKSLHAPYISDLRSSRSHRAAMKVKQSIEKMMSADASVAEDFDVFITGANPPKSDRIIDMIGSLKCSIYIKKEDGTTVEHEIANVSGLTHEWKRKMALLDPATGKIGLNPEYLGKVIAINGLALTGSNMKFQHAVLKDKGVLEFKAKNPSECTWDIEALREMSLIRGK